MIHLLYPTGQTVSYSYGAADRLTTVDDQPYSRDNDGNLPNDGQRQYK